MPSIHRILHSPTNRLTHSAKSLQTLSPLKGWVLEILEIGKYSRIKKILMQCANCSTSRLLMNVLSKYYPPYDKLISHTAFNSPN